MLKGLIITIFLVTIISCNTDSKRQAALCEKLQNNDTLMSPFDPENFMTFDLSTAIRELGEPLSYKTYTTNGLGEFQVVLLNFFPPSDDIQIEELTWNISLETNISDFGIERLTIWYARAEEGSARLFPVTFVKWDINTQF